MADLSAVSDSLVAPARSQKAVVPSNTADLPDGVCKALEVIVSGSLSCVAQDDVDPVARPNVIAGTIIPLRVRKVMATGTTASVLALY